MTTRAQKRSTSRSASARAHPAWWLMTLAAAVLAAAGCHPQRTPEEKPAAIGVPEEASDKVYDAQRAMIEAVEDLSTEYDEAVCTEERQLAGRESGRQALSEAQLEIARALSSARLQGETRRGGGPAEDDDGIVFIEEEDPQRIERGGWECMQAAEQPTCTHAAASTTSHRLYRRFIEPYDLNPVTAGDVMEAFAAEIDWGRSRLVDSTRPAEALDQIEQDCEAGHSPLVRFFEAAAQFDHREVRNDVERLRGDFVGEREGVCQALPRLYEGMMGELRAETDRRMRTGRCDLPRWDPLWD